MIELRWVKTQKTHKNYAGSEYEYTARELQYRYRLPIGLQPSWSEWQAVPIVAIGADQGTSSMTQEDLEAILRSKTLSEALHWHQVIAGACERIRSGQGDQGDWACLNHYAPATLMQAMVRELCLRKAGINSCPNHDKGCRCETCRYWGA